MSAEEKELTEEEEAKALVLLADKVQSGIHEFNRAFTGHSESLWQHIGTLHAIADDINNITTNTTSTFGSVAVNTPVILDTSLNVPMGATMKGTFSPTPANIGDNLNNSMEQKNMQTIIEDYKAKMADINKRLDFVKQEMEKLQTLSEQKSEWTYHRDWEVQRAIQIASVGGDGVSQAVSAVNTVMGQLGGLFQDMDSFYTVKDTCELKKSARKEFAAKIQEVVQHLLEGLMKLNSIQEELQDAVGYI